MAVCNLFSDFNNVSGNFMLFSQYVEDVTKGYTDGDNYKVVPTRFVALNIDYTNSELINNIGKPFNNAVPKYFQNCFENGCAILRNDNTVDWDANISRNLFWNAMYNAGLITIENYGTEESNTYYVPEIMHYGDISMHSYNEHQGMGYGEIYCYIPTSAEQIKCKANIAVNMNDRICKINENTHAEGYDTEYIDSISYPQSFYYGQDFVMGFEDDTIERLTSSAETKYDINTIVVLYSVFSKLNDKWLPIYSEIPLGMYVTGMFDENNNLTNNVTKYVSTSYGSGTSYGLRICTRFAATPNGAILSTSDLSVDDSSYNNLCQLMTGMAENLSKMLEISSNNNSTIQSYKETLSVIKNNRTNVPYVREVNGKDYWFVNGKLVSSVMYDDSCCNEIANETIKQRLTNLTDDDPKNDWTYIEDPNGCECLEYPVNEIVRAIKEIMPDFEFTDPEISDDSTDCICDCNIDFANELEIKGELNN